MAGVSTLVNVPTDLRSASLQAHTPLQGIGVRNADGSVAVDGTDVYRHRSTLPCEPGLVNKVTNSLEGSCIYGGVMGPQFGHVVSQSIGRLWITESFNPEIPLLFLNANPGFTEIPRYFFELLNSLFVKNPVRLITEPARVAELILGPDLCNLERRPAVSPVYLDWLKRHQPLAKVDADLSVYVSRSCVGVDKAQYLQEVTLEAALRDEGYFILHPETVSLADQVDIYQRAARLIFADGSAVHLWSLFSRPQQKVAIVQRRPIPSTFRNWFKSFGAPKPTMLDCIVATFFRRGMGANRTVALLDLMELWAQLGGGGFHSSSRQLGVPRDRLLTWLNAIESGGDAIGLAPDQLDPLSCDLLRIRRRIIRAGRL